MHNASASPGPAAAAAVKFFLLTVLACGPLTSAGAQLYWDTNGATPGSGNAGGDWNAGTNWSTSSAGNVATQAWAGGNQAIFSAGSDGVGVLPIDVSGTVSANGIMVRQGTINLRSGTVNSTSANIFVLGGSTLSLTDSVTVNGTNLVLSAVNQSNAEGAPFNAAATSMAFLNIADNAALNLNRLDVGNESNGQGTVNMSGGTLTLTGGGAEGGLRLGHWPGPAGTRIFNHTGGTLDSTASSGISIGWDGTQAQYNASGSAVIDASTVRVQRASTLNIQSGAEVTATFLELGTSRGAGNVQMSGGTLNVNGETRIGNVGAGAGSSFTISDGIINASGPWLVGWDAANVTMTVNGGTLELGLLRLRGDNSTLNINNGIINATSLQLGEASGRNATGNQTGGTVTLSNHMLVGHWPNETSVYNLSGGTLTLTSTAGNGGEQAGIITLGVDGTGILNHSGGTLTAHGIHLDARGATPGTDLYSLTGGTLVLGAYGIRGNADTSTFAVELGGGVVQASTATQITTPVTLTGTNGNVSFDSNGHTINVSGVLSGPGGLSKTGAGTLILGAANSFAGGTTISGGTISATNPGALGSGTVTLDGGTLATNVNLANNIFLNNVAGNTIAPNGNYRLLSGQISGPGGFTVASGGGTPGLELNNPANDFEGDVTINGGTFLRLSNSEVLPDTATVINNGSLRLDVPGGGIETIAGLTGTGSVWIPTANNDFHTLVVGANDASSTFAGTIGAGGQNNAFLGLEKIGAGTLALTGGSPFGSTTTVTGGTLQVFGTLRETSSLHVGPGATLELGAVNMFVPNHGTPLPDSRAITVDGGTLLMTAAMDSRIGNVNLQNGATWTSNRGLGAWDVLLADTTAGAAVVTVSGTAPSVMDGTGGIHLAGMPVFDVANTTGNANPDLTVSMVLAGPGNFGGSGGLVKNGDGTMRLTAVNTYNGGTIVNAGILDLARPGNSADGTVRGTLTINPGATVITSTTNSLGWGGATRVTELNINGGLLDNTATGDQGWGIAINLNGGTLQSNGGVSSTTTGSLFSLGGGSSVNSLASPDTSVIAGRVNLRQGNLVFNVENGAAPIDLDVSAAITQAAGGYGITLTGDGTMRLTGTTSYTGPTNVQGGTLLMSGNHSASTGPVTVQSGATLGGTGVIGGATLVNDGAVLAPGNSAGTLTFNQDLTLAPGATFEVDVLFGGSATDLVVMSPQTILSVDGATLAGTWGGSDANIFRGSYNPDTMFWIVDHQGTAPIDGRFENTTPAPGFAGLFDGVTPYLTTIDGQLFAAFYESQFGNFSQAGLTGGNDLLLMSIPEPSRALLLAVALGGLLLRRRR